MTATVADSQEPADPAATSVPPPSVPQMDGATARKVFISAEIFRLLRYLVIALGIIGGILAITIPLQAFQPIVGALAGRSTNINAIINVSVVISISLAATLALSGLKMRSQSKELKRQRARISQLEAQLQNQGVGQGPQ